MTPPLTAAERLRLACEAIREDRADIVELLDEIEELHRELVKLRTLAEETARELDALAPMARQHSLLYTAGRLERCAELLRARLAGEDPLDAPDASERSAAETLREATPGGSA